ncbi:MAG: helix-turn-helix domain-containing protein [Syntrophales bacterium]
MNADQLQRWREVHGYAQARLSAALGVHVMTISKWERGIREIPPFLHLALRCLELEGGEGVTGKEGTKKKTKTRKEVKSNGKPLQARRGLVDQVLPEREALSGVRKDRKRNKGKEVVKKA